MSSSQLQYHPTSLERAYASHLLQTYFQTPHTSLDTSPLRVSGREAVPFLTTSGVERTLLRLFWSVADPESVGTLVTRGQFHVLLRLVAMAQAHFLPPLTNTNSNTSDEDKISLLTKTFNDNAHLVIALPTFSADSPSPSVAFLLGTYPSSRKNSIAATIGHHQENDSFNYQNNNHDNNTNIDVSNMLMNHDLQYQLWQQHQQNHQQQLVNTTLSGGLHMMSVSDAFGSLPEVQDRPLPSLQLNNAPREEEESEMKNDNNLGESGNHVANADYDDGGGEDFGDFDGSSNIPLQIQTHEGMGSDVKNQIPSSSAAASIRNDENVFGGFDSTPHNTNDDDIKKESSVPDHHDVAGAGVDAVSIFGVFSNNDATSNADAATLSVSDAFDSLVNQEDLPVQFGHIFASGGVDGVANVVNSNGNDDDDDFGNFDSADTSAVLPNLEVIKAHHDTVFAPDNNEGEKTSSFGMSAFDAFGDNEERPLPPLGGFLLSANDDGIDVILEAVEVEVTNDSFGFGSFEVTVQTEPNENAPIDDSFGTFEGAAVTTPTEGQNDDSFGTFEDVGRVGEATEIEPNTDSQMETPVISSALPPTMSLSGAFGLLPKVEDLPLPPLQSPPFEEKNSLEAPTKEEDELGDFDCAPMESVSLNGPRNSLFVSENSDQAVDTFKDDFGGFESSNTATNGIDSDTMSPKEKSHDENAEKQSNDSALADDFGAFDVSAMAQVNEISPEVATSNKSSLIPATINKNDVANFDSVPNSEEKETHEDKDVGGVNAPSQDKEDFGMSAFDAFGDIEDAPLPPLNSFAASTMKTDPNGSEEIEGNHDDSFGEFEDTARADPNIEATVEDSFGTFERKAEEFAKIQPCDETLVDDSFGTFEGVDGEGETEEAERNVASEVETTAVSSNLPPTLSLSDAFGSLTEVEDLPLPPLQSQLSAEKNQDNAQEARENAPDTEDDEFGDFGSVPLQAEVGAFDGVYHESNQMIVNDFGGFASNKTPQFQASDDMFPSLTDDTSRDKTSSALSDNHSHSNGGDEFGDFGEAQDYAFLMNTATSGMDATGNASNVSVDLKDDSGFGDWGPGDSHAPIAHEKISAPATDVLSDGAHAAESNEVAPDDDFGFWQQQTSTVTTPELQKSESAAATDVQTTPRPEEENDHEFVSFETTKSDVTKDEGSEGFVFVESTESNNQMDAFGDFSSPTSETFSPFDATDVEKIMQPKLDEDTDGFGDFSSFEDNSAQQPEKAKEQTQKSSLSFSRQELISNEYTELLERWTRIVRTVKSDLRQGEKIIEYFSKSLPYSDRAIILKLSKLRNYILGLAEFVRVVRYISATIADVFCLSDKIDLQASRLLEWNDNPVIADAIAVETLWADITPRVIELDILPQTPQLESVVEIRSRVRVSKVTQRNDLCCLTLQPFVDMKCTQSAVDWNGQKFMACAANLFLNRV